MIDPAKLSNAQTALNRFAVPAKALLDLVEALPQAQSLLGAVTEAQTARDRLKVECDQLTDSIEQARGTLERLSAEKASLDGNVAVAKEALAALQAEHEALAPIVVQCREIEADLPAKRAQLDQAETRLAELRNAVK